MKKIFCDRCNRELPTKRKKKFLGLIDYWSHDKVFAVNWENQKELCEECAKSLRKWFKEVRK